MEFVLWEQVLTSVIAIGLTLLIVQYIKPWIQWMDTRLIVFIVANVLLQSAAAIMKLSLQDHLLLIINSFVVSTAAMGSYQETFKAGDDAKKPTDNPF